MEKYIKVAFVCFGILVWIALSPGIAFVFRTIAPSADIPLLGVRFSLSDLIALIISFSLVLYLWIDAKVNRIALEIGNELRQVTWPSWEETRLATVVVIITTIIVSLILGLFDIIWSTVTGAVYRL